MKMSDLAATKDLEKMIGFLKKTPKTLAKVRLLIDVDAKITV